MPFNKPKKVGSIKFDANERREFVKGFTAKKKKTDKKKSAKEKHKKEVLEKRKERRQAMRAEQQSESEDVHTLTPKETHATCVYGSASKADPFGNVTVTTTTWE